MLFGCITVLGDWGGGEFVHRMILRRRHKLPTPILHHKPRQIGRAILKHTYYSYNTYICYVCLIYDLPMFLDLWIWSITLKLNINPRPSYVCLTLEANLTITKVADKECNPFGEYIMYWLWWPIHVGQLTYESNISDSGNKVGLVCIVCLSVSTLSQIYPIEIGSSSSWHAEKFIN